MMIQEPRSHSNENAKALQEGYEDVVKHASLTATAIGVTT